MQILQERKGVFSMTAVVVSEEFVHQVLSVSVLSVEDVSVNRRAAERDVVMLRSKNATAESVTSQACAGLETWLVLVVVPLIQSFAAKTDLPVRRTFQNKKDGCFDVTRFLKTPIPTDEMELNVSRASVAKHRHAAQ